MLVLLINLLAPLIQTGYILDALAMMLSGATSLFPDALFATLGMPKGEENIKDAKQVSCPVEVKNKTLIY